jgi:tetratricopeptide (TPR) repeat protein
MQRVEAAIRSNRCVLAIGGKLVASPDVVMELRRRSVPAVGLSGEPVHPVQPLNAETIAPALSGEGAIIVLVEPETGGDARGLADLAEALKGAAVKPRLFVAARAFNPFALPMGLRLLKFEHLKLRARDFLSQLPLDAPAPAPAAPKAPTAAAAAEASVPKDAPKAPRPTFVGREQELGEMKTHLSSDGGPILVYGPKGVGRRWLVEKAIADSGLERLPDLTFGRGIGADTLLARIASIAEAAENDELGKALQSKHRPSPQALAELAAEALSKAPLAGKVWALFGLDALLDRRNGSLYREDRLGMVVWRILESTPALRIVMVTDALPRFFREGQGKAIRVVNVEGLLGRELHELFDVWHCEGIERDRFGPIHQRTFGHPMSTRALAIQAREDGGDLDALLEAPRLLKAETIWDLEPLMRHFRRRVGALGEEDRKALAAAAHLKEPGTAQDLNAIGVSRNARLSLMAQGLLEQTPSQDDRRYYVHPLVAEHLTFQEAADFDTMERLAHQLLEEVRGKRGPVWIAAAQESNRLVVEARKQRSRTPLPFPDGDPFVESIRGLMRRKHARLDIARTRVNEILKVDPQNTELLLADAELKATEKQSSEVVLAAFARAAETAPTPEVFHQEASTCLDKSSRPKAIQALERGVQAFPANARLFRRLAYLYIRDNRLDEAIAALRTAMELEPMMPDAYGALGEIFTMKGPEHWNDAIAALEEALRLDPENANHLTRRAALVRLQGIVDPDKRTELWAKAEEDLRKAIQLDTKHDDAHLLLGTLLLDQAGDLDQAEWLIKKALKQTETPEGLVQRARVLIRRAAFQEAEQLLNRAVKKDHDSHSAYAGRGELWSAQGQVFLAFDAFKQARDKAPPNWPERAIYEAQMTQLGSLIESGAAAEAMKAADAAKASAQEAHEAAKAEGVRRDPGTTTVLRKRADDGGNHDTVAPQPLPTAAASDEAPTEEQDAPDQDNGSDSKGAPASEHQA